MVEDEENVLFHCPKYMPERKELLIEINIQNIGVVSKQYIIRQIFENLNKWQNLIFKS